MKKRAMPQDICTELTTFSVNKTQPCYRQNCRQESGDLNLNSGCEMTIRPQALARKI